MPEGATATDLVLTVTELLRRTGVVGKFVEFFGPGLAGLPLADRATIANMSPEYGATCAIFPVDAETLRYLRLTGRPAERIALVEAYTREQGLFHEATSPSRCSPTRSSSTSATVEPSVAGPRRPQDRVALGDLAASFRAALPGLLPPGPGSTSSPAATHKEAADGSSAGPDALGVWGEGTPSSPAATSTADGGVLDHGSVVIAAITSCTNTSNPSVMLAAGLLASKARQRGLGAGPG